MNFTLDVSAPITLILVSIRISMLFFATPLDAFGRVPSQVKILWVVGLSFMIVIGGDVRSDVTTLLGLVLAGFAEATIGLVMAFGLYTMFGVFNLAGRLIDFQAGFGAANLFDPSTNDQNPLVGTLLAMLATLLFFVTDTHYVLLKGMFYSFQIHPVGIGISGLDMSKIAKQMGLMFVYGVMFCGPIVGVLMLIDAGIGIMSKSMPQMNVYFVFLPIKAIVCMLALVVFLPIIYPLFSRIFNEIFNFWQVVL